MALLKQASKQASKQSVPTTFSTTTQTTTRHETPTLSRVESRAKLWHNTTLNISFYLISSTLPSPIGILSYFLFPHSPYL